MRILTIGVYGFEEAAFFEALQQANIDLFVDVRRRRGVRGPLYPFANARQLQEKLAERGIRYTHRPDLAPSLAIFKAQNEADQNAHIRRRDRSAVTPEFRAAYTAECLAALDPNALMDELGNPESALFFCVEREPEACHRSLLAETVATAMGATVEHLLPDTTP